MFYQTSATISAVRIGLTGSSFQKGVWGYPKIVITNWLKIVVHCTNVSAVVFTEIPRMSFSCFPSANYYRFLRLCTGRCAWHIIHMGRHEDAALYYFPLQVPGIIVVLLVPLWPSSSFEISEPGACFSPCKSMSAGIAQCFRGFSLFR